MQVYQTFTLILPSLFVFALQGCDVEIMPHYKQAMKVLRLGRLTGGWRIPSNLGYDILRIGGNPLFGELYSAFGLYNKFSFFIEECPCFRKHFLQKPAPANSVIIDILKGKDPSAKHRQLLNMYQALTDSIESTLKNLRDTTPECPVQTGVPFAWNPMRGQDYYYSKIVDDLNLKSALENIRLACIFHMKSSWPDSIMSLYPLSERHCQNWNREVRKNIKWQRHYCYRTG